jgi:hypothetical protein
LPAFFSVFVVFVCFGIDVGLVFDRITLFVVVGVEFVPPEACATTGPAIRTVTMRAAVLVLNMVFSSLGPSQRGLRPHRSRP